MEANNFIEDIIVEDLESGKHSSIYTRFPPEPNGYLHIGHAKSLSINFGIKEKFNGKCNLRFDDTNPTKEDVEYVESIKEDIKWLGYKWDQELYASDYFEKMYECAVMLIKKGLAYVCELSAEEISATRGDLNKPGIESPFRNREIAENLRLFSEMRLGKFDDGKLVLRAKIDMSSPNMNMRDPVIYRILKAYHHRTKNDWCIYPMYDFAHPIEDAIEQITHSICTLEFEDHRPLYDWVIDNCDFNPKPRQIEFARLNIKNTIMSKRFLKSLVDTGVVSGWNDPRMPTISGMRERGYPAEAIKDFCQRVGVAKSNSEVDSQLLDFCVRENLNLNADRLMVVEDPLKLVIDNIPEGQEFTYLSVNNPNDPLSGSHNVVITRVNFIEKSDFSLNPPPKYYRLIPGGMVRLKSAFIVKHNFTELDSSGNPIVVHCDFIAGSESGGVNSNIKVQGTIQWVSEKYGLKCELYKYDQLLLDVYDGVTDFRERLNKDSLTIVDNALSEPFAKDTKNGTRFQFMRNAYYKKVGIFGDKLRFNRIVELRDKYNKK